MRVAHRIPLAITLGLILLLAFPCSSAGRSGFGVSAVPGSVVGKVLPDSAAEAAGLQPGDRIVGLDGTSVSVTPAAQQIMAQWAEGEHVIEVIRDGAGVRLNARVVQNGRGRQALGVALIVGFQVAEVAPQSRAEGFPLRIGDVIQRCNETSTPDLETFEVCAAEIRDKKLKITIMRGGVQLFLTLGKVEWQRMTTEGALNESPGRRGAPSRTAPLSREERLGLQPGAQVGGGGDTAVAVNSRRVARRAELAAAAEQGGSDTLLRDGNSQRLLDEATRQAAFTTPASAARRLSTINVLQYALFAADGSVFFVGTYDPSFPSGPIDYDTLLSAVLETPYPKLSLDPAGRDPLDMSGFRAVSADLDRAARDANYAGQLGNKLLVEPLLKGRFDSPDRQYFQERLKEMFGITKEEFDAYRGWSGLITRDEDFALIGGFADKLLAGGGAREGAGRMHTALKDLSEAAGGSPQDARPKVERLAAAGGLSDRLAQVDQAVRNGGDRQQLNHGFLGDIYERLMTLLGVPQRDIAALIAQFRAGRSDERPLLDAVNTAYTAALERALLHRVFRSFPLSQATLSRIYSVPPIMSRVNTFGGRRDSTLMQVFFNADYTLKYVTTANTATASVPGHLSSETFLSRQEEAAGGAYGKIPGMGNIRFWIRPGDVAMDVIGDRAGVRFTGAAVRIGSEPLALSGGNRQGEAFVARTMAEYANALSGRYDAYARVFPALHVMREAAKLIGMVRWAKTKGVVLRARPAAASPPPLPEVVEGFWGMTFMYRPGASTDLAYLWAHGGVDFAEGEGNGWIKAEPSPKATNDVLEQLAASTALAEKASSAARGGNMENARNLAQRSADAMTGRIDMSGLPQPTLPAPLGPGETLAGRAEVAQAALAAAESNTEALAQARADLKQAQPLANTDPARYAETKQQAQAAADRSEQNLQHLQEMLQKYRLAPLDSAAVAVDLRGLDPNRPATVAPLSTGTAGRAAGCPISPKKPLPTREELIHELVGLQSRLDSLRLSLTRLNRSIQLDRQQFEVWEKEAQAAEERARERLKEAIQDKLEEKFFDYEKEYYKKVDPSPEKLNAIEKIETLLKEKDVYEWAEKGETTWDQVAEGVKQLGDNLPLGEEAQAALWASENIIDSAFDIAASLVSWRRINQLQKNSDAYLTAVKESGAQMRKIVTRMKEIETLLAGGKPVPGSVPRDPRTAVCH